MIRNFLILIVVLTYIGGMTGLSAREKTFELVRENDKFGIKKSGTNEILIPIENTFLSSARRGPFPVVLKMPTGQGLVVSIDSSGTLIETLYDRIGEEGTARFASPGYSHLVRKNGKYGYIDSEGQIIVPLEYDEIRREQLRTVLVKDNKLGLLLIGGETIRIILPAEYDFIQNSHITPIIVAKGGKFGMIDDLGRFVVPLIYDHIEDGHSFPRRVKLGGLYGMIPQPKHGQPHKALIPTEYQEIEAGFEESTKDFKVKKNNLWGFVNAKNEVILPIAYDSVDGFFSDIAHVVKAGLSSYVDRAGKDIGYLDQKSLGFANAKKPQVAGFQSSQEMVINPTLKHVNAKEKGKASVEDFQIVAVPQMVPYELARLIGSQNHVREFMGVFLINRGAKSLDLRVQDGQYYLVQEAQTKSGVWKKIETWEPATCGNSYGMLQIASLKQRLTVGRRYKGALKTKLRFAMKFDGGEIYSNEFDGSVNPEMLR